MADGKLWPTAVVIKQLYRSNQLTVVPWRRETRGDVADDALQTLVGDRVLVAVQVVTVTRVFDENHHRLRVRLRARPLSGKQEQEQELFDRWCCCHGDVTLWDGLTGQKTYRGGCIIIIKFFNNMLSNATSTIQTKQ